jgi:hypothetical protein
LGHQVSVVAELAAIKQLFLNIFFLVDLSMLDSYPDFQYLHKELCWCGLGDYFDGVPLLFLGY